MASPARPMLAWMCLTCKEVTPDLCRSISVPLPRTITPHYQATLPLPAAAILPTPTPGISYQNRSIQRQLLNLTAHTEMCPPPATHSCQWRPLNFLVQTRRLS